ncbi:hypothetical protein G6O67_003453 [Ophiocordyceps sinensis]|uniref:Uncharacterized protein n=1 Tax=Ophiocordyceps sinensis TaxID=72228 RepID=A0A8H4PWH4_9HYPO|nr:hypothetical protein G6O67_003453 [Ophiocordyceps sinensis]
MMMVDGCRVAELVSLSQTDLGTFYFTEHFVHFPHSEERLSPRCAAASGPFRLRLELLCPLPAHNLHQNLVPHPPGQETDTQFLERMGPVPDDDAMPAAGSGQSSPGHCLRIRDKQRWPLLEARNARDSAHADAQQLDLAGAALERHLEPHGAGQVHEELLAGAVGGHQREPPVGQGADVEHERGRVAAEGGEEGPREVEWEEGVEADVGRDARLGAFTQRHVDWVGRAAAGVVDEHGQVQVVDGSFDGAKVDRHGPVRLRQAARARHRAGVCDEGAERSIGVYLLQLRHDEGELGMVPPVQHHAEAERGELVGKGAADAV